MVVGGCSWLASCCWVVVGGCFWLAVVVVGRLWAVFLVGCVGGSICGVFIVVK